MGTQTIEISVSRVSVMLKSTCKNDTRELTAESLNLMTFLMASYVRISMLKGLFKVPNV